MGASKIKYIKSPLNYTGGKYKLLPQIEPLFPKNVERFIDLFCGGCNVAINVKAKEIICNDIEGHVISLMNYFNNHSAEEIINGIEGVIDEYELTRTWENGYEYYGCNSSDGVAKVNKDGYLKLREDYNNGKKDEITFYTMLIHAFNNQINFNQKGEFNQHVNKRDFNQALRKNLKVFVDELKNKDIKFIKGSFESLKVDKLNKQDFVYCDPPYLITAANYNKIWGVEEEIKLLDKLDEIHKNGIKFALSNVLEHKGKRNELLINWSNKYIIHDLNFDYKNCNYASNKKENNLSREVLITNY